MSRASNVITLVLLGSALALIGWSCYEALEDSDGQGRHTYRGHGSHFWFWGGGGRSWGTSSGGGSAPSSSSGTVHGGFGSTGSAASAGS
jgi:hypothetical protein